MTTEAGHNANRVYLSQNGDLHFNAANVYDVAENVVPQKVTFSVSAGASNISLVTIQVQDARGSNVAAPCEMLVYLSDAAAGGALTATTASGAVAAGTAGTDLSAKVSKKAIDVLTDATGKYILSITDTAKTGFYVAATCPGTGVQFISPQLVTANYG